MPDVPPAQRTTGQLYLRYEDICQDGRLLPSGLPQGVGFIVWRKLLRTHPITRVLRDRDGIVPILSRLAVEAGGGPLSVSRALDAAGCYQLAHARDRDGEVSKLFLNMWVDAHGVAGLTHGPQPANAGARVWAGRVFAEHVFTKLFAPPEQRKVLSLDLDGAPEVPETHYAWRPPEHLLELPPGAEPLEDELSPDVAAIAFGLIHTDSNQHVNSLVYPRLFLEAALRRIAALGVAPTLLARHIDITYRKPCFVGDRVAIALRAFRLGDEVGAVGAFVPERGDGRPYCFGRVVFAE